MLCTEITKRLNATEDENERESAKAVEIGSKLAEKIDELKSGMAIASMNIIN